MNVNPQYYFQNLLTFKEKYNEILYKRNKYFLEFRLTFNIRSVKINIVSVKKSLKLLI